jgi:hypothetical protein
MTRSSTQHQASREASCGIAQRLLEHQARFFCNCIAAPLFLAQIRSFEGLDSLLRYLRSITTRRFAWHKGSVATRKLLRNWVRYSSFAARRLEYRTSILAQIWSSKDKYAPKSCGIPRRYWFERKSEDSSMNMRRRIHSAGARDAEYWRKFHNVSMNMRKSVSRARLRCSWFGAISTIHR